MRMRGLKCFSCGVSFEGGFVNPGAWWGAHCPTCQDKHLLCRSCADKARILGLLYDRSIEQGNSFLTRCPTREMLTICTLEGTSPD